MDCGGFRIIDLLKEVLFSATLKKRQMLFLNYIELKNLTAVEGECEVSLRSASHPVCVCQMRSASAVYRIGHVRCATCALTAWACR